MIEKEKIGRYVKCKHPYSGGVDCKTCEEIQEDYEKRLQREERTGRVLAPIGEARLPNVNFHATRERVVSKP